MSDGYCNGSPWTVLVYMGCGVDPKFEKDQDDVLNTIAKKAALTEIECVYSFARAACLERGRIRNKQREVLSTSPPIDITDPTHLTQFLDWAGETFPARYTALFAKDHGQGSIDRVRKSVLTASGIFMDRQTHRYMPMPSFRRAIRKSRARRVDVLGLDACRLGSVEVAYELREAATFLVVSEMTEPTTGWAYAAALDYLDAAPDLATPRGLVGTVVEASTKFRLAGLELAWIPPLATALDALGTELSRKKTAVLDWVTTTFPQTYTDGVHIERLVDLLSKTNLCNAAVLTAITDALDNARVETAGKPAGIGVYFPTMKGSPSIASYGSAAFAGDTSWAEFLGALNHWILTDSAP